jgi:hypothetical protein
VLRLRTKEKVASLPSRVAVVTVREVVAASVALGWLR